MQRMLMTWKDRKRTRVPSVDISENPCCVERQLDDERSLMQLNRNPSLKVLTSADVRRTASFAVEQKEPPKELQRKKRHFLRWALRRGLSSRSARSRSEWPMLRVNQTAPHELDTAFGAGGATETISRRRRRLRHDRDLDIDIIPNLEPYRREVVAQHPITFGHRPLSASRMFNPCNMTMCKNVRSSSSTNMKKGFEARKRNKVLGETWWTAARPNQRKPCSRKYPAAEAAVVHKRSRPPGLTAPLLRELLRTNRPEYGLTEGAPCTPRIALKDAPIDSTKGANNIGDEYFQCIGGAGSRFGQDEDVLSEASNVTMSNLPGSDSDRDGALSRDMTGEGCSPQELELRRIFSLGRRPPWDDTPAPLPAPGDSRPAISSLNMPDPEERLRDKLARSRKAAAGTHVTASIIRDEDNDNTCPKGPTMVEASPATPRTVIAYQELIRVKNERQQKAYEMARRVRRAELRVSYEKIAGAEKRYRDILARGLKPYGGDAVTKAMAAVTKADASYREQGSGLACAQ